MAETFVNIAMFCLGLCVSIMVLTWAFEKIGIKFHDKFVGYIFVTSFIVGSASALVGMLLSL